MGGLAGEGHSVAFHAESADHHAHRLVHLLEHGALLDVKLQVSFRGNGFQFVVGFQHVVENHAVFGQALLGGHSFGVL